MLEKSINGRKWKQDVMRKLTSFADKCPLLISITTGVYKSTDGVYITCNQNKEKYFFKWIYDQDPKIFIHDIKTKILNEYPRILQYEIEERKVTAAEAAKFLEEGIKLEDIPKTQKFLNFSKVWRIDKVLPWKQIFILELESMFDSNGQKIDIPESEKKQRKYQYNGAAVIYLRNYRQGLYKSIKEAGDEFFKNSNLISSLKKN